MSKPDSPQKRDRGADRGPRTAAEIEKAIERKLADPRIRERVAERPQRSAAQVDARIDRHTKTHPAHGK
jgi:hypothetical protein